MNAWQLMLSAPWLSAPRPVGRPMASEPEAEAYRRSHIGGVTTQCGGVYWLELVRGSERGTA